MTLLGHTGNWPGGALEVEGVNLTIKNEYAGTNLIYTGSAAPGTAVSAAAWAIRKLTYDGSNNPTDVQWASGSAVANKVWNDRASYSYS